jgi:hypothetical protein
LAHPKSIDKNMSVRVKTVCRRGCVLSATLTRQMKEMCKRSFNASVIATLYAGERTFKGLKDRDVHKAYELGKALTSQPREA